MQHVDLVVIGGGLAGLTAAGEAARLGLSVTGFTGPAPGGLLLSIDAIEGMPEHADGIPGYDLCPMAHEAAMDAGAQFISQEAVSLTRDGDAWIVRGETEAVAARAVVLAPGAVMRALGVDGEARLAGKGVSHCANCDGPLLRGRPVAVVGGGDAACQESLTLAAFAQTVHLLVRGERLRARPAWRERVMARPKIRVHFSSVVECIEGEAAVSSVRLRDGRNLIVDAVFVYAGLVPATSWLGDVVARDDRGAVVVDAHLASSAPGVFAAGVARSGHSGQAVDARADGAAAARAAAQYLRERVAA